MICCTNNKARDAAEAAIRERGLLNMHRGFGLGTAALPLEQPTPIRHLSPKNKGHSFSIENPRSNLAIESARSVPSFTGDIPFHSRSSLVEHPLRRFSTTSDSLPFIIDTLPRFTGSDESHLRTIVFASCNEPSLGRRIFTSADVSQAPLRHATAGVIIWVGEHYYQLTAGHLFEPESKEFDAEPASMCLDECHFDGQSDDEEYDSNHELEVTGRGSATSEDSPSCGGSSSNSTSEGVTNEHSTNMHRVAHPKLHRTLNRQYGLSGSPATKGKQKAVSRSLEVLTDPKGASLGVPIGSLPQGRLFASSIDYAIIALPNDSVWELGWGINRIPRPYFRNIKDVAEVGHSNRGIIVVTYTTLIEGVLIPGKVSYKSRRSHQFERLVQIELERGAHEGDCGSPVIDKSTGSLYGHIIMGVPGSKVAYIVQALDIFKDIEARIGEPVSVATKEDRKKMKPLTSIFWRRSGVLII
ncbi:hypothetical protein NUW58_g1346 [Xylaria curta]|uniref:Uncharacterized protein n=1 Tax=Xylaria curta TaxID=42375 RepID=A0ACC1PNI7_9PEZI|nr:hypothetical protein NUW58_g1346 [Xylaria curta]